MSRTAEQGSDPAYKTFIESLPCCAPSVTECQSPPPQHAHHSTGAGMALKAPDREALPLCWRHHQHFHEGDGPFDGWSREERRRWQEEQVERCLAAHVLFEGKDIR